MCRSDRMYMYIYIYGLRGGNQVILASEFPLSTVAHVLDMPSANITIDKTNVALKIVMYTHHPP